MIMLQTRPQKGVAVVEAGEEDEVARRQQAAQAAVDEVAKR